MWLKSIVTPVVLIPTLVILQISYGKPTESPNPSAKQSLSTELPSSFSLDVDKDGADVNSTQQVIQTVSILLTVLSPNDTWNMSSVSPYMLQDANANSTNSTLESEYYNLEDGENDHMMKNGSDGKGNITSESSETSSTLSGLELDFDTLSMHIVGNGETSTESSLLITEDEMDVAGSLDEAVTASVMTRVREDRAASVNAVSVGSSTRSSIDPADDDSIIVASVSSSNLNVDTVEPPSSHALNLNEEQFVGATEDISVVVADGKTPSPTSQQEHIETAVLSLFPSSSPL